MDKAVTDAVELLKRLIATPSLSRDEARTAELIAGYLTEHGAVPERLANNVWVRSEGFDPARPTLLLNSHHDTVRPTAAWTRDPSQRRGRANGSTGWEPTTPARRSRPSRPPSATITMQSCLSTCCWPSRARRSAWANTACAPCCRSWERSTWRSSANRRACRPPSASGGLVVLDCEARGKSGHAARNEGINALYIALDDIARLRSFRFDRVSELLGPIGIAVTQIAAGTQHNVVPDSCRFVVDLRTTDAYTNEETVEILRAAIRSDAVPRSTRIRASALGAEHPLMRAAGAGRTPYVSPTTSDMALMPFPSLKMGPGQSSRSHTADEFVLLTEIAEGIAVYENYIEKLALEYGKTLG